MTDRRNFFDRFDIADDADLTKPQGGMERPQTRAALERSVAPPPAPPTSNFFDRFDGGEPSPAPTPAPTPQATAAAASGGRSWGQWWDQTLQGWGVISPEEYDRRHPLTAEQRAAPVTISAAPERSWGQRFMDSAEGMAEHYSPSALAARAIAAHVPSADTWSGLPGADNSQAAQARRAAPLVATNEREWRDLEAQRAAADPIIREGDHWYSPGSIMRGSADFLGGMAGGAISDPTTAIAPGGSFLTKMLGQAAVGGVTDLATQGGEVAQGVRDEIDPAQAAFSAATGAGFVGGVEGLGALRRWWKGRGINVDNVPDDQLVSGSLDGTIGDTSLTPDQVQAILIDAGAPRGMDQFSSPERAAAAALRVQDAQTRTPFNARQAPDQVGAPLEPRVVPENVAIIAAPEGPIRSDDLGSIAGVDRKRAADATVLTEAQQRVADDPLVANILDSNLSPQAKVATIWQRLATPAEGADMPDLPAVPNSAPWTAPTPGAAAGIASRQANPGRSRIHDITMQAESRGRRYDTEGKLLRSGKGAQGEMQVMPGTSRDPGYGVRAAQNDSPDELARVGRDYIDALRKHYQGDMAKAWAAYNAGPGAVDGAIEKHGARWFDHMPAETRAYVNKNVAALGGSADPGPWRMGAPDEPAGLYSGRSQPNEGRTNPGETSLGDFEDPRAATSPSLREMRDGVPADDAAITQTGGSDRLFRSTADDADFEARAQASTDEQFKAAMDGLQREWQAREQARREREANRGANQRFQEERVRGEEQSKGDPSGLYRGKYAQKPHQDGTTWRTTPEGFIAGADGKPVAFRSAREAATWAAKNKMGGDFELGAWATNSKRVVLKQREGSTYGQRPQGPLEPAAGRSADESQRLISETAPEPAAATPPTPPAPAAPVPPAPRVRMPEDVLTFIARKGGLRDDEGHNLRARSVNQGGGGRGLPQFAPGGGHVFRKGGMTIDRAGEVLHEAGFFPAGRPTEAEVLSMLDEAGFERQFRPADVPAAEEARRSLDDHQWLEQTHDQLSAEAERYGHPLTEPELAGMRDLMADGRSAEQAYIEHHEREAATRLNEFSVETLDPEYDIPFDEDFRPNDRAAQADGGEAPQGAGRFEDLGGSEGARAPDVERPRGEPAGSQLDAFPERPGDQRAALERRADEPLRADATQQAPGSEGGLFDQRDTTGDMFDASPAANHVPEKETMLDALERVREGAQLDSATGTSVYLHKQGFLVVGADGKSKLTPKGRAELIRAGRSNGDGESGFIDLSDLGKLFRGVSPVDGIAIADDMRAVGTKLRETVGSPKAALKATVSRLAQFAEPTIYSADGALRSMAGRLNAPTLTRIADLFHAPAGKADGTGRTYHEAVDIESRTRTQQVYDVLEPHLGNKASMRRIRDLLARPNDASIRASVEERGAAGKVRDMLKDVLEYRRNAGEELGEVSDGYFPRVIDALAVAKSPEEFQRAATKLYREHGVEDPDAAAAIWARNIMDSYAGIDGGYDAIRAAGRPNSSKAREFGKAADAALAEFYKQDPFDTLATYMLGAARRAEETRRFGAKGRQGSTEREAWTKAHGDRSQWDVMMDRLKDELRASSGDVDGVPRQVQQLRDVNLGKLYKPGGKAVSLLHAWNTLSVMDRATISSLGDLAMGFVRGGPRYGFKHLGTSLVEFAREVAKRPPSEARRYAEAVGVANDAFGSALLHARADAGNVRGKAAAVTDGFYRAIGLQQLTDAGRVAATKTGQRFLSDLAQDLESGGRTAQRARFYLRELGVKEPEAFGAELRNGAPSADALMTRKAGFSSDYATALMRYVNQSILMPARSERPKWAQHPVGSLFFALQSYSYGFAKNVLHRQARLAGEAVRQKDPLMLASASGLMVLAGLTYLNDTYLRPALFGTKYDYADETPTDTALRVADRAGVLGPASQLVNMFKGFKYQREPTSALAGPIVGRIADGVYRGGKLAFYDNPRTDTDERNAAGAVYDLLVEPALDFGAVRYAKGPLRTAGVYATGNRYDNGLVPSDREAFVDGFGGPDPDDDGSGSN